MRKITFNTSYEAKGDLLVIPICEGESPSKFGEEVNQICKGALSFNLQIVDFKGKKQQLLQITTNGSTSIPRVLFLGLGPRKNLSPPYLQEMGGFLATVIASLDKVKTVVLDTTHLEKEEGEVNIPFGLLLREWQFHKYKSKEEPQPKTYLQCLCNHPKKAEERFHFFDALYQGISTAKELTSEPANYVYPEVFAERCLALKKWRVEVEIIDEMELERLGANALLSVGKGSCRPSRMVILKWLGKKDDSPPIVLVGKGVCFDSGGINIKTTGELGEMKWDKACAAIVTGIVQSLAFMQLPVNVIGVLGLVENMPDGKAMKPGDIISTLSGKTVEVVDTDNEGRLVLADCMWYAQHRFLPKILIDFGTLTLETMGALAGEYAGLFCNDEKLAQDLLRAGNRSGEKVWQLPLGEPFAKQIQSEIADVKNMGQLGFGESSASAEFLKFFVKESVAWAHLDFAGVAFSKEESLLHAPGVTGYGVRLIVEWLKSFAEGKDF